MERLQVLRRGRLHRVCRDGIQRAHRDPRTARSHRSNSRIDPREKADFRNPQGCARGRHALSARVCAGQGSRRRHYPERDQQSNLHRDFQISMAIRRQAKPRLACEITSQNVIAARAKGDAKGLDVHTLRRLDGNMIRPALTPGNVSNPAALGQAVESALSAVGGRKRDVILVLPDAAVRVLLMDFDALPDKFAEAEPIVRFRLRKSVPFDADQAALSFQIYRKQSAVKVLAAITPREVLSEYESPFRTAGYEPGIVLP